MHINIVQQYQPSCQGTHVDPEMTISAQGVWVYTDNAHPRRLIVETLTQGAEETTTAFCARLEARASELDREYACSRCYR